MLISKNLKIGFPHKSEDIVLVDRLDLQVKSGTFTAIIGRNGSGKTTLLRTLAGLHQPLEGQVFLTGMPLSGIISQERAKLMALVNTERFSLGYFTVQDLVALGRHPHSGFMGILNDKDEDKIQEACEATGILPLRQKAISQLSDGEHQKVMIARALAQATPLLLMDEPTAHLDLINRIEIFQLLKKLCSEKGRTIVLCTHELEVALNIADNLVLLDGEGKTFSGSPENLINSGKLESIFTHKSIRFDKFTRRFLF